MIDSIRELIKYRELLYMIVWRDIRIKYKQSVMGIMWAVFMPIMIVLSGIVVRYGIAMFSGKPLDTSSVGAVVVKSVPWAFLIASIRFSTNSLVGNSNLLTKIYFPRAVLPVAAVLSQMFDFAVASCMLVVVLTVARVGISIQILWVPVLFSLLFILAMGIGLFFSAANLFYRDVKYVVEVVLTFAIFVTPVFYEAAMFGKWSKLLMFNPVAPILEGFGSTIILHQAPSGEWIVYSAVVSLLSLVLGFAFFRKVEPIFAERI